MIYFLMQFFMFENLIYDYYFLHNFHPSLSNFPYVPLKSMTLSSIFVLDTHTYILLSQFRITHEYTC